MKRSKLIFLTALTLATVMLLSSCGIFTTDLSDLIDSDSEFTPEDPHVLNTSMMLEGLSGAIYKTRSGELLYFVKNYKKGDELMAKRHLIYNSESNEIIFDFEDVDGGNPLISTVVTLHNITSGDKQYDFFKVTQVTKTYNEKRTDSTSEAVTRLYDTAGNVIAEAKGIPEHTIVMDALFFDGKCYKATDDGIAFAFDYSSMASIPQATCQSDNYYYEVNFIGAKRDILVYDDKFNFISSYKIPSHASPTCFVILESGDIFLQYVYLSDSNRFNYTFMADYTTTLDTQEGLTDCKFEVSQKYNVVTQIIKAKNGKADEVDCDYIITHTQNITKTEHPSNFHEVMDTEKYQVFGVAAEISDQRCALSADDLHTVTISNKGKVTVIPTLNGERITYMERVSQDRWLAKTATHTYNIDMNGDIISDITKAVEYGDFLFCDGIIYDKKLNELYNLGEGDYTIHSFGLRNALLLKRNSDLYVYNGRSEPVRIGTYFFTDVLHVSAHGDYFTVANNVSTPTGVNCRQYTLYNTQGVKVAFYEVYGNASINYIGHTEDSFIVQIKNFDGNYEYYRVS